MAPNSPYRRRRILRLGVVVAIALALFFYYLTSKFTIHSVVELLRGHAVAPDSSSPLGQDVLRDDQEPIEWNVKRGVDSLSTGIDVVSGTSSSRRVVGGSVMAGIALAGPVPTGVLIMNQQLSASSSSAIASVGSPKSSPASGSPSAPTARPPEGTVADGSWTGGGNKPSPTGSPVAMANPGASLPTAPVSFTTAAGNQRSDIITTINTVYMAGVTSISTVSIDVPCPAPSLCSTDLQTCNCPLETSQSQCRCPLQSTRPETCACPFQPCSMQPTVSLDDQGTENGACPHIGYTCDDCIDGWFCPPPQTPAQTGPNGCFGWPCSHCSSEWFCVPQPTDNSPATSTTVAVSSSPTAALALPRRPVTEFVVEIVTETVTETVTEVVTQSVGPNLLNLPDLPMVLSLAVSGFEATVVTMLNNVFPTPGAGLGQLAGQSGQSTHQPNVVLLPGRVGWNQAGSYSPAASCSNGDTSLTSLTPTPSGGGFEPCSTTPTTKNTNTSPCAITGLNEPNNGPVNDGRGSDRKTVPGVESNPTVTLSPEGSDETSPSSGFPAPSGPSPVLAGGIVDQSDTSTSTSGPSDSDPTGNAYKWPSGVVPYGNDPAIQTAIPTPR
ncbi:hypothetical protein PG996_005494 [Apiospora saccharicola]|uniref:Transmembrane protein n=1 Tax=Apiospora saccharicola TaxID=335842 RepID=A0ABR1VLL8_9PEZI